MAPAHSSTPRSHPAPVDDRPHQHPNPDPNVNRDLFVDPMLGQPLAIYIEKDVNDKEELVRLLTAYGGAVATGYSGVTYILVDPLKTSGQNLYRQYAGKKGKVILDARWIRECIKENRLMTYATNWAGCKVTGEEQESFQTRQQRQPGPQDPHNDLTEEDVASMIADSVFSSTARGQEDPPSHTHPQPQPQQHHQPQTAAQQHPLPPPPPLPPVPSPARPPPHMMPYPLPTVATVIVDPMNPFPHVYAHPIPPPPHGVPPHQPWPVAPHMMAHMMRPIQGQPEQSWDGYHQQQEGMHHPYGGEYRYRETQGPWLTPHYYEPPHYDQAYNQTPYMQDDPPDADPVEPPQAEPPMQAAQPQPQTHSPQPSQPPAPQMQSSTGTLEPPERTRGRKRTRVPTTPATPATELVTRSAPARSPTPPSRIIKSTYGGNLFTADDVLYLKKYIDYCKEQGLVLSLREICERVAIKAPHHTFYSWRRYCNKHQIRLSGYTMTQGRDSDDEMDDGDIEEEVITPRPGPSTTRINAIAVRSEPPDRDRSPTPPRALFRSTTGKGVAFTEEDVTFLVRYMRYKETQGRVDMVVFWKEVAAKAPHHSRASWMKYWRRHKHELMRTDNAPPLPPPPEKKRRYIAKDDIKLAKFFQHKRSGTSDQQFQEFAAQEGHGHHPWKGWQEHYRIHKTKIDHLIERLHRGENIDNEPEL